MLILNPKSSCPQQLHKTDKTNFKALISQNHNKPNYAQWQQSQKMYGIWKDFSKIITLANPINPPKHKITLKRLNNVTRI